MNDRADLRVRNIIAGISTVADREISGDDRLVEDLGLNSMALIELSVVLESEFDLGTIDGGDATRLETVADVEKLVAAQSAKK